MSKHVLVTGGAGFIGSHLCEHLLESGDSVTVLDDFSTGRRENLAGFKESLRIVEGSVTDPAAIASAAKGVDAIVHLAALPSVARSVEAPLESHEKCTTATVMVLDHARKNGLRVVYAGSSSAYGDQEAPAKQYELAGLTAADIVRTALSALGQEIAETPVRA